MKISKGFYSFLTRFLDFCFALLSRGRSIGWLGFREERRRKLLSSAIRRFSRFNCKVIGDDASFRCKCKIDVCLSADKLADNEVSRKCSKLDPLSE